MDECEYVHTRTRKDIGRTVHFEDAPTVDTAWLEPDPDLLSSFTHVHEVTKTLDTMPVYSVHTVNTDHVEVHSRGQVHFEGGWSKEIDPAEPQDTAKWTKRLDKDPQFAPIVTKLCHRMKKIVGDNKIIDLYDSSAGKSSAAPLELQTFKSDSIALFKDPHASAGITRAVSRISWHPDPVGRFVSSYTSSHLNPSFSPFSYIWECDLPNQPLLALCPSSPLLSIQMYQRNGDLIVGGCIDGFVNFFDTRVSGSPAATSSYDHSHTEGVSDVSWILSKTHSEIVSTSTDGRVIWWDIRQLASGPVETCDITPYSGTCIEWQQEAGPTKFLIGTQEGIVMSLNKRPKKPIDIGGWFGSEDKGGSLKHTGPVISVKRNMFHPKYFLSVGGDNCIKLWLEDIKSPIFETPRCESQYLCGAWSPSRASVFVSGRMDGVVDFCDYSLAMGPSSYMHKVSEYPIMSVSMESKGRMLAAGDACGTITLLNLSDELAVPIINEKIIMGSILEREQRREKNLDTLRKQQQTNASVSSMIHTTNGSSKRIDQHQYMTRETEWFNNLGLVINPDDMSIRTS